MMTKEIESEIIKCFHYHICAEDFCFLFGFLQNNPNACVLSVFGCQVKKSLSHLNLSKTSAVYMYAQVI